MATEKRLIDANALIEKMENTSSDVCADYGDGFCQHGYSTQLFRLMVSESPTVDAVEVVHGRWEKYIDDDDDKCCRCTGCGWRICYEDCSLEELGYNYCPNCGAKMDGGNENG